MKKVMSSVGVATHVGRANIEKDLLLKYRLDQGVHVVSKKRMVQLNVGEGTRVYLSMYWKTKQNSMIKSLLGKIIFV